MSLFTKVQFKVPKRNAFNLSHENHCTAEMGTLYPILIQECLPGDKFKLNTESVVKLAPMLAPVFSRIDVYFHYFFVPNRLVYSNWEKFITGGENGLFGLDADGTNDNTVSPYFTLADGATADKLGQGSLADFMGIPTLATTDASNLATNFTNPINAIPFLCYHKIFSDWFRDELLQATEFTPAGDGQITSTALVSLLSFHKRAWHKDYFTSARPDTQLGAPVSMPITGELSGNGPFRFKGDSSSFVASTRVGLGANASSDYEVVDTDGHVAAGTYARNSSNTIVGNALEYYDGIGLDEAGVTINDFRRALKLQEWAEKNMRGGNRYIENIFNHFGVRSSDARLQRSQYLGGKKVPVMVGEITQSVDTNANSDFSTSKEPLGRRAGVANSVGKTQNIKVSCEEHGFIIGLMSIMPHASYFQGIPRYLAQRFDKFDYAWPEFGNLGEQDVFNYELFLNPAGTGNLATFGYQSRFAEYKYTPSSVHGDFKNNLAYWHNARKFNSAPSLNESFIQLDTSDQNRIFAVTQVTTDHFYCHLYNNVKVLRMLPKYGVPSI